MTTVTCDRCRKSEQECGAKHMKVELQLDTATITDGSDYSYVVKREVDICQNCLGIVARVTSHAMRGQ